MPYHALRFGGAILTERGEGGELKPATTHYAVVLDPMVEGQSMPDMAIRGRVIVSGAPESYYQRFKKQVLKVFVREMGV